MADPLVYEFIAIVCAVTAAGLWVRAALAYRSLSPRRGLNAAAAYWTAAALAAQAGTSIAIIARDLS
jgi:hypothetical protein